MSISNVLHFSPASRFTSVKAPSLTADQEYGLIAAVTAAFLAGSTGIALYALSALGQ
jgi:hypothetical protein